MKKFDNELHNLYTGDYLQCSACKEWIYRSPIYPPYSFKFKDVTNAYYKHARCCMGLRRLIVTFGKTNTKNHGKEKSNRREDQ